LFENDATHGTPLISATPVINDAYPSGEGVRSGAFQMNDF
jgi:hypothetical protein